jgi:ABC-type proline/glycine betaine transport system substrate-binding protein
LPAVAIPAVLAGVALPAFAKAKDKAQGTACANNLKQIDGAKHQWALENKKADQDVPTWQELKPYLGGKGKAPKCPSGGKYTIGSIDSQPTCSKPGHELN